MKIKFLSIVLIFVGMYTQAQSILNAKSPEELRKMREEMRSVNAQGDTISTEQEPLPYGFIEERDVLWQKVVWEVIDMNEKINQTYFYSSDGITSNSVSLFDALKKGIESGRIKEVYNDEFFTDKLSPEDAIGSLKNSVKTDYYYDLVEEHGEDAVTTMEDNGIDDFEIDTERVKMIKVKGMWYIDKRIGEMRYRILGIAMMGPDAQSLGQKFVDKNEMVDLFWIWYPDARKVLHNYTIFNPQNSATKITYDDMLNARRFNSIIYKSENSHGNKSIEEYLPKDAHAQLEESMRIKNSILQKENDMWNY